MRQRFVPRQLIAAVMAGVCVSGCADFFPSFSNNLLAPEISGDRVPVAEVLNSVQCEVAAFLMDERQRFVSDENPRGVTPRNGLRIKKGSTVDIKLNVNASVTGGVNYSQIDASDTNLLSLFLIAGSKDIEFPKLTVDGTGENTIEIDTTLTIDRDTQGCHKDGPALRANTYNVFSRDSERRGSLGLHQWMHEFFKKTYSETADANMSPELVKLTMTTKFVLDVSFNSSVKRLIRIIPIQNFPVAKFHPTRTHTLTITFIGEGKKDEVAAK